MACTFASVPICLLLQGRRTHLVIPRKQSECSAPLVHLRSFRGRILVGRRGIVAKAAGDSSGKSSGSIVKFFQDAWSKSEDRVALVGLGFAGIITLWASINLVEAIDKLPFVPGTLEFVGILFSWWFVYRYLLFKPDREELVQNFKKSLSDVLGR